MIKSTTHKITPPTNFSFKKNSKMRNPNPSLVQQLLLIIQIILLSSSMNTENFVEARFYQNDATVKIYNDLGPDTTLMINCNSKNDDLGTHYLKYK